jgi:hypothetical protein
MEAMGICMLFNECEPIVRDGQRIFLAGVDDPHFYRADDIERAASQIPSDAFSILLRTTRVGLFRIGKPMIFGDRNAKMKLVEQLTLVTLQTAHHGSTPPRFAST